MGKGVHVGKDHKGIGNPNGPKFTDTEREAVMARVQELDRLYWTQERIAKEVGLSIGMVSKYLLKIRQRYQRQYVDDARERIGAIVDEYRTIKREAWEAYQKSKRKLTQRTINSPVDVSCPVCDGKGDNMRGRPCRACDGTGKRQYRGKITTITRERDACMACLQILLNAIAAEREMLGIDAPKELNVQGSVLYWDALAQAVNGTQGVSIPGHVPDTGLIPDMVEKEIEKVVNLQYNKETGTYAVPDAPDTVSSPSTNGEGNGKK